MVFKCLQTNLIAKLMDFFSFFSCCLHRPSQWHLNIFALGRLSIFNVEWSCSFRCYFNLYFNAENERQTSNEPTEIDSFQFIQSENLSSSSFDSEIVRLRCDFRYYHITQVVIVHLLYWYGEWYWHSIIFMFHIFERLLIATEWNNISILIDGISLIQRKRKLYFVPFYHYHFQSTQSLRYWLVIVLIKWPSWTECLCVCLCVRWLYKNHE